MQDTPNTPNTSDTDTPTSEILSASERAAIDGLLRWQLGRRMTVCLLALVDTHGDEAAALSRRLASVEEIAVTPPAASAEGGLNQAARTDAEVTLVWLADDADEMAAASALLERAEAMNLADRCFIELIGPAVTRDLAHKLRFEEGYPADTPTAQLLWSLAREAIARDELRRRGSSPPCYL